MTRTGIRKTQKSTNHKSATTAFTSTTTTSSVVSSDPPKPFEPAPRALLSFAKTFPHNHVFAVHLEGTPAGMRRQAFAVPVLLNFIITAGLILRLIYAAPVYMEQMNTIFGYETGFTVKPKELTWPELVGILLQRTFLLSVDYALFGLVGRWPYEFLFGDKHGRFVGAAGWKWNVGFTKPKEVVVRRGRKWDTSLFLREQDRVKQGLPNKSWSKEEELAVHTKSTDALRSSNTSRNALQLLDRDWDLDYKSMIEAHDLIDEGSITHDQLDGLVLVHWDNQWCSWYPKKVESAGYKATVNQANDLQLEDFKKKLTSLNCEDIFYRWIEIVQYETSLPDGFTTKRKQEAETELRRMLRERKQDSDAFIKDIGGISAIPGLNADA